MRNYRYPTENVSAAGESTENSRWRRYYTRAEQQRRRKYFSKYVKRERRRRRLEKIKKVWDTISTIILLALCIGMPIWILFDAFEVIH